MKRGRLILCVTAIFAALYWAFLIPYTVAELREGKSVQRGAALQRTDGISRILQDEYGRIFPENGFSDRTDYFRARMVASSGDSYTLYEEYQPYAAALLDADGAIIAKTDALLWVTDRRDMPENPINLSYLTNDHTVYCGYFGELMTKAQKKELFAFYGYTRSTTENYHPVVPMFVVRASFHDRNGELFPVTLTFRRFTDDALLTLTLSSETEDLICSDADQSKAGFQFFCSYWAPEGSFLVQADRWRRLQTRVEEQAEKIRAGRITASFDDVSDGLLRFREDAVQVLTSDEGENYYLVVCAEWDNLLLTVLSTNWLAVTIAVTVGFAVVFLFTLVAALLLQRRAARTRAQRRALLAAAAHELKTPLTVMQNQCECLLENVAPEKNAEYLASIAEEASRVESLAERFRNFASLSDIDRLNKKTVLLHEMIERETEKYISFSELNGATVETRLDPIAIDCDEALLSLAIDNLLSNAIRYATGEKRVILRLTPLKNGFVFRIGNDGEKLSLPERRRIWDPLYRRNKARTGGGSGLGLPICARVFRLHRFRYGCAYRKGRVIFWFGTTKGVRL